MPSLSSLGSSSSSLSNKASQLLTDIHSQLTRRDAIFRKETSVSGHKFEATLLSEYTKCSQCNSFIWGLVGQRCKQCRLMSHKKCLNSIESHCSGDTSERLSPGVADSQSRHEFKTKTYLKPTLCDHCGVLIKGLWEQGEECLPCRRNVHHDCARVVSRECQPKRVTNLQNDLNSARQIPAVYSHRSKISIQDFEIVRLLGTGSFSKVYLAKLHHDEMEKFAIKVIKKTNLRVSSDPDSVFTEWRALNLGRQYPFLTVGHCCFQSEDRLFFVMEYVRGRDLLYHMRKARKFSEDRAKFYAAEIVLALMYLHRQRIIYRDLKLDNIILDEAGHCKLLDFGMSKILDSGQKTRTFCGTPSYMSPEIIRGEDYDYSVDWWALGVLMFEMLVGSTPFEAETEEGIYRAIAEREIYFPTSLSDRARSVLEGLLAKEPQNRLGCQLIEGCGMAIKQHPFFLFVEADGIERYLWDAIEVRTIKPPYRPSVDDLNMDSDSQGSPDIQFSPSNSKQLKNVSHADFDQFSFYSDSFRDLNSLD